MKAVQKRKIYKLLNSISARNRFMSMLLLQVMSSYKKGDHMLAFVGSLIALEQTVRFSVDVPDEKFDTALQKIRDENKITFNEYSTIAKLDDICYRIFHENVYATALTVDGIAYGFSEDSTYEYLLDKTFVEMLQIIEKLSASA